MSKGSNPRNCFSHQFKQNYESIEWRERGTFCEDCNQNFKNPGQHHWDENRKMWICNPNGNCNYN